MSDSPATRSDSPSDQALTAPGSRAAASIRAAWKRLVRPRSLSRVQAVIGTLAGIVSITGAAYSVVQASRGANTGDLVAIVKAASSRQSVTDATIEVLTPQNALVATLTPESI